MIPNHLQRLPKDNATYYGTLKASKFNGQNVIEWVIEGEPDVIQFAKRVFPGSSGRYAGEARFPNTKRITADLNWFMIRYPLKIENQSAYEQSYNDAVDHAIHINEFNERPVKLLPPREFKGTLLGYQGEGHSFLVGTDRTLLADEMGLGKTIQALAAMATKQAYPCIIVAPAHLLLNWKSEINKFIDLPGTGQISLFQENTEAVHIIKGLTPYDLPTANIYLIHYGLLRGWKNALTEYKFKLLIFDEIQELRNTGTEKYSAASLLAEHTPCVWGLSGTPIYNYGDEMWSVMNILELHCLGDKDSFSREWCYGYGSRQVVNPDQLGSYLRREGLMLRRRKSEVLTELPPKRRVVQSIDFDNGTYSKLIHEAIVKANMLDGIKDPFEKGRITREIVKEGRQAIGIAKSTYVATFVKMLLEAEEKVILGAYHHSVFDILMDELKEFQPVKITGKETAYEKSKAVEAFMSGRTNLVMLQIRSASGLNLQRATCVVAGELDWSPAIHSQFEDRAHRIGQVDSILCYYLVANEGTDEAIQEVLGLKIAQFAGVMDDKTETEEDKILAQTAASNQMAKVVQKLKERGKPNG